MRCRAIQAPPRARRKEYDANATVHARTTVPSKKKYVHSLEAVPLVSNLKIDHTATSREIEARYGRLSSNVIHGDLSTVRIIEGDQRLAIKYIPLFVFDDLSTNMLEGLKRNKPMTLYCAALRELTIMKRMTHGNIVSLREVLCGSPSNLDAAVGLVMPYVGPNLAEVELNSIHRHSVILDVLKGLSHMHMNGIIHRDIKPQNILLSSNASAKICDFGLSKHEETTSEDGHSMTAQSFFFRAPEIQMGWRGYGTECDIWAYGNLCYYVLIGKYPFYHSILDRDYSKYISMIYGWLGVPDSDTMAFYDQEGLIAQVGAFLETADVLDIDFPDVAEALQASSHIQQWAPTILACWDLLPYRRASANKLLEELQRYHSEDLRSSDTVMEDCNERGLRSDSPSSRLFSSTFWNIREVMIEWLIDLQSQCNTDVLVLYKAIQLHDRWLRKHNLRLDKYQLFGAACYIIAASYSVTLSITLDEMTSLGDSAFTRQELREAIMVILEDLNYDISEITTYEVFRKKQDSPEHIEAMNSVLILMQFVPTFTSLSTEHQLYILSELTRAVLGNCIEVVDGVVASSARALIDIIEIYHARPVFEFLKAQSKEAKFIGCLVPFSENQAIKNILTPGVWNVQ